MYMESWWPTGRRLMMMIMKSLFIHSFLPTALPPFIYLFIHSFIHSSDDAIIIIIITYVTIQYNTIQYNNDAYMLLYVLYTETGVMKSNDHHLLLLLQLIGNQKYWDCRRYMLHSVVWEEEK